MGESVKNSLAAALCSGENGKNLSRDAATLEAPTASLTMQPDNEAAMAGSPYYRTSPTRLV